MAAASWEAEAVAPKCAVPDARAVEPEQAVGRRAGVRLRHRAVPVGGKSRPHRAERPLGGLILCAGRPLLLYL